MVTKTEMNESIEKLKVTLTGSFKQILDDSISELKNTIIENLKKSNEQLSSKVRELESEVKKLKDANIDSTKRSRLPSSMEG